jgi:hypothetical protein
MDVDDSSDDVDYDQRLGKRRRLLSWTRLAEPLQRCAICCEDGGENLNCLIFCICRPAIPQRIFSPICAPWKIPGFISVAVVCPSVYPFIGLAQRAVGRNTGYDFRIRGGARVRIEVSARGRLSTQVKAICIVTTQRIKRYRKTLAVKQVTRFATVLAAANITETVVCERLNRSPFLSMLCFFLRCLRPLLELLFIANIIILLQSPHRQYFF